MKPLKLEIQGFQSFEEKQIIDFENLTKDKLFGIFGNTGSGKSTILDAVIYALYTSTPSMNGSNIVTSGVNDIINVNSKVILINFTFSLGGNIYEVERNSLYTDKDYIIENNVPLKEGRKKVTEAISDIIGLELNDFTRTVILPQGKFSEFLKLENQKRRKMLENIFSLEEYGEKLHKKAKHKKEAIEREKEAIENEIRGIGEGSTKEALKDNEKELKKVKDQLKILEIDIKRFDNEKNEKKDLKDLYQEKSNNEEEKVELLKKAGEVEISKNILRKGILANSKRNSIDELKEKKSRVKGLKADLKKKIKNISNKEEEKTKREKLKNNLKIEKETLEETRDKNQITRKERDLKEKLSSLNQCYSTAQSSLTDKSREQEEIVKDIEGLKTELLAKGKESDNISTELEGLKEVKESEILRVSQKLENLHLEDVRKLEKNIDKTEDQLNKANKKSKKIESDLDRLIEVEKILLEKEKEFIAGKLAKKLEKEGGECPVCGSTHHPKLAVYTEEDLSQLEESLNKIDDEKNTLLGEKEELNLQGLKTSLEKDRELLGDRNSKILTKKEKSLKEEKISLEAALDGYTSNKKRLEDKIKKVAEEISNIKNQISEKNGRIQTLIDNIKGYNKEISRVLAEAGKLNIEYVNDNFLDVDTIGSEINNFNEKDKIHERSINELKEVQKNIDKAVKEVDDIKSELSTLEGEKNKIDGELSSENNSLNKLDSEIQSFLTENKDDFNDIGEIEATLLSKGRTEELNEIIDEYKDEELRISNKSKDLKNKIAERTFDSEAYEILIKNLDSKTKERIKKVEEKGALTQSIKKINSDLGIIKEKLTEIDKLKVKEEKYQTLTNLIGSSRFVEFLSASKIKNVAKSASIRLGKISSGRYALTADSTGSFFIIDNFNNGEKRKSSTLSGGETFLVSLSLALALSKQLQLKGNVNLDFFFLDEGFGTLDANTLDKVMDSLEKLKDESMIVGIISHVEELKDRVPRRLQVTGAVSGEHGSKVVIV